VMPQGQDSASGSAAAAAARRALCARSRPAQGWPAGALQAGQGCSVTSCSTRSSNPAFMGLPPLWAVTGQVVKFRHTCCGSGRVPGSAMQSHPSRSGSEQTSSRTLHEHCADGGGPGPRRRLDRFTSRVVHLQWA
jgi:hypothetical protein